MNDEQIQRAKDNLAATQRVVEAGVHLVVVRLSEVNAKQSFDVGQQNTSATASFAFRAVPGINRDNKLVGTTIIYKVDVVAKDPNADAHILSITIRMQVEYQVAGMTDDLSDDDLEAFSVIQGVLNSWPYFREFVTSLSTRMTLSPIFIPLITAEWVASSAIVPTSDSAKPQADKK